MPTIGLFSDVNKDLGHKDQDLQSKDKDQDLGSEDKDQDLCHGKDTTSTYSARTRTRTRTCVARTRTSTLVVTRTLHVHQGLRFLHKILRIQTVVCIGRT